MIFCVVLWCLLRVPAPTYHHEPKAQTTSLLARSNCEAASKSCRSHGFQHQQQRRFHSFLGGSSQGKHIDSVPENGQRSGLGPPPPGAVSRGSYVR
jgi:hypothetical protein